MSAELDRVREYRRAARLAVQHPTAAVQDRYLALIDLCESARAEPDPLVQTWAERAVWAESKVFLGVDDDPEIPPEPFERAQRAILRRGLTTCPNCLRPLATEADFARWRNLRLAEIQRLERRQRAVDA